MTITRRAALRNCFIITIGSALIPSCRQDKTTSGIVYKNLKIDGKQEALISELCETIIPKTDTPGAKDTYTHLFVLKMLDDMFTTEEQDQFIKGLREFDKLSEKKFDKSFTEASVPQKEELVAAVINKDSKEASEAIAMFINTTKKLTVQGYMTSKYYLTNVRVYKLVPGRYYGCIPVTSLQQKAPSI